MPLPCEVSPHRPFDRWLADVGRRQMWASPPRRRSPCCATVPHASSAAFSQAPCRHVLTFLCRPYKHHPCPSLCALRECDSDWPDTLLGPLAPSGKRFPQAAKMAPGRAEGSPPRPAPVPWATATPSRGQHGGAGAGTPLRRACAGLLVPSPASAHPAGLGGGLRGCGRGRAGAAPSAPSFISVIYFKCLC